MSKNDKKPVAVSNDKKGFNEWSKSQLIKLVPVIDWTLKAIAVTFLLTTSFCFVRNWLQANQVNHDFSLAGAILVLSIVLYLIVRKR